MVNAPIVIYATSYAAKFLRSFLSHTRFPFHLEDSAVLSGEGANDAAFISSANCLGMEILYRPWPRHSSAINIQYQVHGSASFPPLKVIAAAERQLPAFSVIIAPSFRLADDARGDNRLVSYIVLDKAENWLEFALTTAPGTLFSTFSCSDVPNLSHISKQPGKSRTHTESSGVL